MRVNFNSAFRPPCSFQVTVDLFLYSLASVRSFNAGICWDDLLLLSLYSYCKADAMVLRDDSTVQSVKECNGWRDWSKKAMFFFGAHRPRS